MRRSDRDRQRFNIMSINWVYWQLEANNSVIVHFVCGCVNRSCVWLWSGLLWRWQHFWRLLPCSCVIVLSRKWCHPFVLFPSWHRKWTRREEKDIALSVCLVINPSLSLNNCLGQQWEWLIASQSVSQPNDSPGVLEPNIRKSKHTHLSDFSVCVESESIGSLRYQTAWHNAKTTEVCTYPTQYKYNNDSSVI